MSCGLGIALNFSSHWRSARDASAENPNRTGSSPDMECNHGNAAGIPNNTAITQTIRLISSSESFTKLAARAGSCAARNCQLADNPPSRPDLRETGSPPVRPFPEAKQTSKGQGKPAAGLDWHRRPAEQASQKTWKKPRQSSRRRKTPRKRRGKSTIAEHEIRQIANHASREKRSEAREIRKKSPAREPAMLSYVHPASERRARGRLERSSSIQLPR